MLTIRLQRVGRRNFATFRMVVTEHTRQPQSGKYVEMVGWWNPHTNQADIEKDRVSYWLSVGAQPTDTVHNLLVDAGIIAGKKRNVLPKKHAPQTEGDTAQETPAAAETTEGEAAPSDQEAQEEAPAGEEPQKEETAAALPASEEAEAEPEAEKKE